MPKCVLAVYTVLSKHVVFFVLTTARRFHGQVTYTCANAILVSNSTWCGHACSHAPANAIMQGVVGWAGMKWRAFALGNVLDCSEPASRRRISQIIFKHALGMHIGSTSSVHT